MKHGVRALSRDGEEPTVDGEQRWLCFLSAGCLRSVDGGGRARAYGHHLPARTERDLPRWSRWPVERGALWAKHVPGMRVLSKKKCAFKQQHSVFVFTNTVSRLVGRMPATQTCAFETVQYGKYELKRRTWLNVECGQRMDTDNHRKRLFVYVTLYPSSLLIKITTKQFLCFGLPY